ncbi:MAG: ethanolamine ammonia-lyase subunit EutC [Bdellovibrionales bacterium]
MLDEKIEQEIKNQRDAERINRNRGVLDRFLKNQDEASKPVKIPKRSQPGLKIGSRPWHQVEEGQVPHHQALGDDSQTKQKHEPRYQLIPNPKNAQRLKEFLQCTAARLGVWRAGVRPKTKVMLDFLADHAIAKRAVYEDFPSEKVKALGCFEVRTQIDNKDNFLLRPDLGRVLKPECAARLKTHVEQNPDVQIVISDGLSGIALNVNIEKLLPFLKQELSVKGYKIGTPIYCRYGRVTLQDRIGEIVNTKVSIILIGERPGLGTGDGLSAYLIYNPNPTSTHANRNCISNIHPRGLNAQDAARYIGFTVSKMFEQKKSGVDLDIG